MPKLRMRSTMVMSLGTQKIDFAQLIKIYSEAPEESRYSPAKCIGTKTKTIYGNPDPDRIGTSRIERHNLSMRMENRRFTRLTNAFSKKWANHHAALPLYLAYYNFCRMHKTFRCTPAMAQGITNHVWELRERLFFLNSTEQWQRPKEHSAEASLRRLKRMRQGVAAYLEKGDQGIKEHLDRVELENQGVQDHSSTANPN